MSRASTKLDLLRDANNKYIELIELLAKMSQEKKDQNFSFDISKKKERHWKRDKNIKDVLIHLYEWHHLIINWVSNNENSEVVVAFFPEPYNWRTYGELNNVFTQRSSGVTELEAEKMLEKSHEEVIEIIQKFSNEQLFSKKVFKWVGNSTLGSYLVSVTASHYDWAIKKIKEHINS